MKSRVKSTIMGVLFTLMSALGGGVGIATLIAQPFDFFISVFVGFTFIVSSLVCWGWACFARKELYE